MKSSAAIVIAILAATQAFAQSPAPAPVTTTPGSPLNRTYSAPRRRGMSTPPGNVAPSAALHQRIEDMQTTLENMHALMKEMRAKATKSGTKDPLTKANLDMWSLMVGHLDKQLEELKVAETARADMEARRAALYKQADAKAEAEARAARAAQAGKFADQEAATAGPAGAASAAPTPAAAPSNQPATPSPATPATSPN